MAGVVFRVILLIGLAGTAYYAFLRKNRLPLHLVVVLALLGGGAALVLFPALSNDVAHALGLWRGGRFSHVPPRNSAAIHRAVLRGALLGDGS